MILRRLTQSLKEQDWTAIWIEFILLVAGVFLGMQVSNWNEDRRDRILERQYLGRLREDFALSVSAAQDSIETMDAQTRGAMLMLENLRACRLDEPGQRAMQVLGFIVARRSAQIGYVDARSTFLATPDVGADATPGPDEVLFDFPALCQDPTYVNAISHLRQLADVVARQNRRLQVEYQAILKLLDAELGKGSA